MSSSGITATNSGPLAIRTYNSGSNKTFVLTDYDVPVSTNFVLITSSNGQLVPTNSPTISSIQVSSIRDRDGFTGEPDEVLHTNGSTVFWAPIGAGSGYWDENGNNIFNKNSGNVGIGTSIPSYKLDVNGDIRTNSTFTAVTVSTNSISTSVLTGSVVVGNTLTVPNVSTTSISSNSIINNTYTGNGTTQLFSDLQIYQPGTSNYTRYLTLADSAYIDLANTTGSLNIVNGILIANNGFTVGGGATINGGITLNNNTGPNGAGLNINTGNIFMNGAGSITVSNGNITLVSGSGTASGGWITSSDERLKNNINTIVNPLSTLTQLRGVSYYLNKDGSKHIGVIAQEVEKVLPEVVKTDTSDEGYKSVTYGNMVALTIEAIKELSKTVNELNNKVSILMSK